MNDGDGFITDDDELLIAAFDQFQSEHHQQENEYEVADETLLEALDNYETLQNEVIEIEDDNDEDHFSVDDDVLLAAWSQYKNAESITINSSNESDLEFITEAVPSGTQRRKAVNLGLPPTFFLYERHVKEKVDNNGEDAITISDDESSSLSATNYAFSRGINELGDSSLSIRSLDDGRTTPNSNVPLDGDPDSGMHRLDKQRKLQCNICGKSVDRVFAQRCHKLGICCACADSLLLPYQNMRGKYKKRE